VTNMKNKLLYLALLLLPAMASAQVSGPGFVNYVTSAPSGACSSNSQVQIVYGPGTIYACQSGIWANAGSGGTGTVTSVICGTGLTGGTITTTGTCAADLTVLAPLASPALTGNPTVPTQAATDNSTRASSTAYVTTAIANAVAGVNPAVAVKLATTQASDTSGLTYANGVAGIGATLTGSVNTALTIDGVALTSVNQRVLVKNDTQSPSGAFNGVYFLSQLQTGILPPVLTRALDFDTPSDMNSTGAIPVVSGTVNASTQWVMTSSVTTVGTDPATFTQFSSNPSNLVTAVSPGVGLCHFAGSTQACTSSLIVNADITNTTIDLTTKVTGVLPAANGGYNANNTAGYIAGGGTAQAQTATLSPALSANTTGASFTYLPSNANTATGPTLAVNGLTAKTITKCGTVALVANDLVTTAPAQVIYDGTEWVLQNPQAIGCAVPKIQPSTGFFVPYSSGTSAGTNPANTTRLWAVDVPVTVTSTKVVYQIITTADNTGNLYDIGYYDVSGNLVCHIGATAGTTFSPSTGIKTLSWLSSCTLTPGRYYEAETDNSATALVGGNSNTLSPACAVNPATNNTTSGGALNATVTYSADSWTSCTLAVFGAIN
jgi:hypothetical protein